MARAHALVGPPSDVEGSVPGVWEALASDSATGTALPADATLPRLCRLQQDPRARCGPPMCTQNASFHSTALVEDGCIQRCAVVELTDCYGGRSVRLVWDSGRRMLTSEAFC